MRLHLPGKASNSPNDAAHDRQPVDRRWPPGVLTRWLRQGLRSGMCPLCRVAHKADREYIWHFFDEGANEGEAIDVVQRAYGFCREHVDMLCRIEIEGMQSALGISTMFADTFAGIVSNLDSLTPRAEFQRAPCLACANRDKCMSANAQYLLDELATNPGLRERFDASPGLCFAHFELVRSFAQTTEERELLDRVQRDAASRLLTDLQEHVRKQDHRFRHEPKGAERDSWRRAVYMTAGWPPPSESAGEPEAHR